MQCQKLKTYMETGRVVFLPARSIRPNPAQPRKIFKPEALDELSDSIRQHGILQPLSVRRSGNSYELISGERRLRAAELAGVTDIPCIIMNMDDKESGMAARPDWPRRPASCPAARGSAAAPRPEARGRRPAGG